MYTAVFFTHSERKASMVGQLQDAVSLSSYNDYRGNNGILAVVDQKTVSGLAFRSLGFRVVHYPAEIQVLKQYVTLGPNRFLFGTFPY